MTSKRRDTIVIACGTLLFAAFLVSLYFDITKSVAELGKQPIGVLVRKERIAQRRASDRVVWILLKRDEILYNKDAVRTDVGSSAVIRLDDSTEIQLDENSLVVLDFSEKEKAIQFLEGSVVARRVQNASDAAIVPLVVKADKAKLNMSGGVLSISRGADEAVSVGVSGGTVTVSDSGETSTITENQSLSLEDGKSIVSELSLVPLVPSAGAVAFGEGPRVKVDFSWTALGGASPFFVEISQTRDFIVFESVASRSLESAAYLAAGSFFWRIRDSSGNVSKPLGFSVTADIPPIALEPKEGEEFVYRSELPSVSLAWEVVPGVGAYEYEVATDGAFSATVAQGSTSNQSMRILAPAEGSYYWRVRALYEYGGLTRGKPTDPRRFIVRKSPDISAPELLLPDDSTTIASKDAASGSLLFVWQQAVDVKSYEFELRSGDGAGEPSASWTGTATFTRLPASLIPGMYRWAVRSVAVDGTTSLWSASRRLTVARLVPPDALAPADGLELERALPYVLGFSWAGGGEARLTLFSDAALKEEAVSTVSSTGNASISMPGYGTFFWTVSNAGGTSKPRAIRVEKPLQAATILAPANDETVDLAHAARVVFAWSHVPDASSYRLTVRDSRAQRPAIDVKVAGTGFEADRSALAAGTYVWSVFAQIESAGRVPRLGPLSSASFTVLVPRTTIAPRILAPVNGAVVDGLVSRRDGIRVVWEPSEAKAVYSVRVTKVGDASRPVFEKTTRETSCLLQDPGSGSYLVSVGGEGFDGVPLPQGQVGFKVDAIELLEAARIRQPAEGSKVDITDADFLTFAWSSVQGANAYGIRLTQKAGGRVVFSKVVEKATAYLFRELELLDVGEFIFRVEPMLIGTGGSAERFGEERLCSFSITVALKSSILPALLSPKEIYVQPKR